MYPFIRDMKNIERITMKKFLSVIMVVLALLSITACGPTEAYLQITEPGTHPLQVFGPDNKQEDADWKWAANQHIRITSYGVGDEIEYLSYADMYACGKIGAYIRLDNPYIFPAKFENAKVTVDIQISYRSFVSQFEYKHYTTDPVSVEIELDEKGFGEATVWVETDQDVQRNTYYNGKVQYCENSTTAGVDFSVIARISDATGTVTYYEKVDPTPVPKATPTASPEA